MHTAIATTHGATPMTKRPRDTRTALAAYMEHHVEVTTILERLLDHYRGHDDAPADGLHWGHVGDIAHAHAQLRELSDWVFGEGEHAA
jgi:3-mercaptopyruvate sulfurtransferase SseA